MPNNFVYMANKEFDPTVLRLLMNTPEFLDEIGHPTTIVGTVTHNTANKREGAGAAQFSAGSYLRFPASDDWELGQTFTIEFSAYRTGNLATNNRSRFIAFGTNGWATSFCLQLESNGSILVTRPFNGGSTITFPAAAWNLNEWTDVMLSVSNGTASLYSKGQRVAGPTAITVGLGNGNEVYVGSEPSAGSAYGNPFPGILDRVVVTKGRALVDPTSTSYIVDF